MNPEAVELYPGDASPSSEWLAIVTETTKGEFGEFHRFMDEMWKLVGKHISGIGLDLPLLNPATNPHILCFKCFKILVLCSVFYNNNNLLLL